MSNLKSDIMVDIEFGKNHDEFKTTAPMLRWVAAINPDATRATFVEACVEMGFKANTAANRFRESRVYETANGGVEFGRDGAIITYANAEEESIFGGVHAILRIGGAG